MSTHPRFELKKSKNGGFHFCLTAANGQVIAQSQVYTTKDAAENGIHSVQKNAPKADIADMSEAQTA